DQADNKDSQDGKNAQDSKSSQDSKNGKNDSSKDAKAESPQQLAEEQKDLAQKTGELQKDLDQLSKESQQAGQDQLDKTNQELQEQDPSGEMDQASKQLQQQQSQGAQPHQQKAQKSLRSLYQQLMEAQQQMSMQQDAETTAALQKAARQALDVSFRQEDVTKESATAARTADEGDLAVQQQSLVSAAGTIATDPDAVSQKTSKAPSQVQAMLGEAMGRMRDGVRSYEKGDPITGRVQGEEAYGILNRIVVELNRSSSSSCQKPGNGQGAQQ